MTREEAIKMLKSKMDGHTDTSYEWCECVRMAVNALEQEPCKWIPVKSGILPKGYERVLVTRKMFHWANEPVEYTVDIESFSGYVDFVAWMPLPEPYNSGK